MQWRYLKNLKQLPSLQYSLSSFEGGQDFNAHCEVAKNEYVADWRSCEEEAEVGLKPYQYEPEVNSAESDGCIADEDDASDWLKNTDW